MNIKCFFRHKYTPFKVVHCYSVTDVQSTTLISTCCRKGCGRIKYNSFYGIGFLELEDFK